MSEPRIVALIPARAGSQRVKGKNTRGLAGHPLLAYAIGAAQEAGIFDEIIVSSDDADLWQLVQHYGPMIPDGNVSCVVRPPEFAEDGSPDIGWVSHVLKPGACARIDAFCILRPTSPFRRGEWIRQAWEHLQVYPRADSIRAVRACREHPAKMWRQTAGPFMAPVMVGIGYEAPHHSMPTQLLPKVYTQTAALEIAWTRVLPGSISGAMVLPYFTDRDAPESLDINEPEDFERAERLAAEHPEWLPEVRRA